MATITIEGNEIHTVGELPAVGSDAPAFTLTNAEMGDTSLADYAGKRVILNIFVAIDTGICAESTRRFNAAAGSLDNTVVLCISADLPPTLARFCGAENLDNVVTLSTFRSPEFGQDYGLTVADGPIRGLNARSVIIIDENGKVVYTEQVPEIAQEPDYDAALTKV
ncbi:MAG: thiol peroxidase [Thiotrichales bacterium]|nr:MAG: thiol peroxidase [Thiotrichales bacterium]